MCKQLRSKLNVVEDTQINDDETLYDDMIMINIIIPYYHFRYNEDNKFSIQKLQNPLSISFLFSIYNFPL